MFLSLFRFSMADDLIAMFSNIRMDDHDTLSKQFSNVMGCEQGVAVFFLESCGWNVEQALNTFLSSGKFLVLLPKL